AQILRQVQHHFGSAPAFAIAWAVTRHDARATTKAAAWSSRRGRPNRPHQAGKSAVGPVHSQSSTVPTTASVRTVANSLNVSAFARWVASVAANVPAPRTVTSQSVAS